MKKIIWLAPVACTILASCAMETKPVVIQPSQQELMKQHYTNVIRTDFNNFLNKAMEIENGDKTKGKN